jgi:chemotaxis methyl-accepting protein methylase
VQRELRQIVLFAEHDVVRDPPFSHIDLIAAAICSSISTAMRNGT